MFEEISVREHLEYYAKVKGAKKEQIKSWVESIMENLGLTEYSSVASQKLSGGNKWKLSVAISLIGESQILFLDEPSTGMDPRSKRFLWNVLHAAWRERAMILTTHSMEEAEALSTWIGIMAKGEMKCIGTL